MVLVENLKIPQQNKKILPKKKKGKKSLVCTHLSTLTSVTMLKLQQHDRLIVIPWGHCLFFLTFLQEFWTCWPSFETRLQIQGGVNSLIPSECMERDFSLRLPFVLLPVLKRQPTHGARFRPSCDLLYCFQCAWRHGNSRPRIPGLG